MIAPYAGASRSVQAFGAYQDKVFRNLSCKRLQVDEIWSFTYAKDKNVRSAKAAPDGAGDTWTFTAIDADTKLVMSGWFALGIAKQLIISCTT